MTANVLKRKEGVHAVEKKIRVPKKTVTTFKKKKNTPLPMFNVVRTCITSVDVWSNYSLDKVFLNDETGASSFSAMETEKAAIKTAAAQCSSFHSLESEEQTLFRRVLGLDGDGTKLKSIFFYSMRYNLLENCKVFEGFVDGHILNMLKREKTSTGVKLIGKKKQVLFQALIYRAISIVVGKAFPIHVYFRCIDVFERGVAARREVMDVVDIFVYFCTCFTLSFNVENREKDVFFMTTFSAFFNAKYISDLFCPEETRKLTQKNFSNKDYKLLEARVLQDVGWIVTNPLSIDFLEYSLYSCFRLNLDLQGMGGSVVVSGSELSGYNCLVFFMNLLSLDLKSELNLKPSFVAAFCIYKLINIPKRSDMVTSRVKQGWIWPKELTEITGYDFNSIGTWGSHLVIQLDYVLLQNFEFFII